MAATPVPNSGNNGNDSPASNNVITINGEDHGGGDASETKDVVPEYKRGSPLQSNNDDVGRSRPSRQIGTSPH
jgi:hypothetical protein